MDICLEWGDAELLQYEVLGNGIRLHFKALQSALIDQSKAPKEQFDTLSDTLADRMISLSIENSSFTQDELAERTKLLGKE